MLRTTQPAVSVILGRLALLLLLFPVAARGTPAPGDKQKYDRGGVGFASVGGPPEGPCLIVAGWLAAPEFFTNLEKRDSLSGARFQRSSEVVRSFPEELSVRLTVSEFPCHVGLLNKSPLKLTPEDMKSLRVTAYWKRGMRVRPVERFEIRTLYQEKEQIAVFPTDNLGSLREMIERGIWTYEFTLASRDVPLTDHLILVILTKDGKRLARVSARL